MVNLWFPFACYRETSPRAAGCGRRDDWMGSPSPTLSLPLANAPATARLGVVGSSLATLALAVIVTGAPLVAQLLSPLIALPLAAVLAFALANHLPRFVPAVVIFATMFQNTFVSLLSPWIADTEAFNFIRGYTFFITVVCWLVLVGAFLARPQEHGPLTAKLIRRGIALLLVIGAFAAFGLIKNGSGAIIYTRNIVTPILLLHLMLLTAGRERLDIGRMIFLYALLLFGCGWLEMTARPVWLTLTNGESYWELNSAGLRSVGYWEQVLKQTGFVFREMNDFFRINLFNTPYLQGIVVLRLHGPNIHAISFGYALAFMALFLAASGRPLLAALAVPLLVLASTKGAMLVVAMVVVAWGATRLLGARPALWLMLALLVVYATAMFVDGLATGDYHVIGLLGGLKGFASNPIGHGIGSGGNLTGSVSLEEWSKAQNAGTFEGAVESAVGVLLYQMGASGLLVLAYYLDVAREAWRRYARSGLLHQGLAAFGTMVVVVNGLFQEEALFSPLALGLMLAFAGLVLGAAERVEVGASRSRGP